MLRCPISLHAQSSLLWAESLHGTVRCCCVLTWYVILALQHLTANNTFILVIMFQWNPLLSSWYEAPVVCLQHSISLVGAQVRSSFISEFWWQKPLLGPGQETEWNLQEILTWQAHIATRGKPKELNCQCVDETRNEQISCPQLRLNLIKPVWLLLHTWVGGEPKYDLQRKGYHIQNIIKLHAALSHSMPMHELLCLRH